jgi:TonB family protein
VKKANKKFLKLPEFPGGKEAFKNYIKSNLKYPEQARENNIEGTVLLSAEIDDNGDVLQVKVEKSVGYGCNEEAIRLLENVKFGKVKNRGRRVKTWKKFKIPFKLPPQSSQKKIVYNIVKGEKSEKQEKENPAKYSYKIKIE